MLVVCWCPINGNLVSTGSTPSSRHARSCWNSRVVANADREAFDLLNSSGFSRDNFPKPQTTLYWIDRIVLPAQEAMHWLLKKRLPGIEWFILDPQSAVPIDLNDYVAP